MPIESLGFPSVPYARVSPDGSGGHDVEVPPIGVAPAVSGPAGARMPQGNYSGVWLSTYEYFSSSRDAMFTDRHFFVLLQHGDRLTARSLSGADDSSLTMDLTIDGNVITGVWVEQTATDGYYRGGRYHGAIQMLVEPTGRRMAGKWVGFGKDMDVNTGPWTLTFQDASTSKATLDQYNRRPGE